MLIAKQDPFTGNWNSIDIDVTVEQLNNWRASGELIQNAFPNLTADEREFLMTGITPDSWTDSLGNSTQDND